VDSITLTTADLWIAFVVGVLVGISASAAWLVWRTEGDHAQLDTTRPPLAFYPGTKTGRQIWGRGARTK